MQQEQQGVTELRTEALEALTDLDEQYASELLRRLNQDHYLRVVASFAQLLRECSDRTFWAKDTAPNIETLHLKVASVYAARPTDVDGRPHDQRNYGGLEAVTKPYRRRVDAERASDRLNGGE